MTYPASLRQQAAWVREALDPATPDTQRITLGDVDVEELEAAADHIEKLEAALRIIAGYEQCIDNLMSNQNIAIAALAPETEQ
jgi:hypothetical protein